MKYQSDIEGNRTLVGKSLRESHDDQDINFWVGVVEEIRPYLHTNVTRRSLMPYVLENKYEIAAWKAIAGYDEWTKLVVEMQAASVPVRDINQFKQIVEQQFLIFLEDVKMEMGVGDEIILRPGQTLIIKGVRTSTQTRGDVGITYRLEG